VAPAREGTESPAKRGRRPGTSMGPVVAVVQEWMSWCYAGISPVSSGAGAELHGERLGKSCEGLTARHHMVSEREGK
jgi:hypothetical protein